MPNESTRIAGTIILKHWDRVTRQQSFDMTMKVSLIIDRWMHEIKPAIKRGDKIKIEIEF